MVRQLPAPTYWLNSQQRQRPNQHQTQYTHRKKHGHGKDESFAKVMQGWRLWGGNIAVGSSMVWSCSQLPTREYSSKACRLAQLLCPRPRSRLRCRACNTSSRVYVSQIILLARIINLSFLYSSRLTPLYISCGVSNLLLPILSRRV